MSLKNKTKAQLIDMMEQLKEENSDLEMELFDAPDFDADGYEEQISELETIKQDLEEENEELRDKISELEDEISELKSEKFDSSELDSVVNDLETALHNLENVIDHHS